MTTWWYTPRTGAVRRAPLRIVQLSAYRDVSLFTLRRPWPEPFHWSVTLEDGRVVTISQARAERVRHGMITRSVEVTVGEGSRVDIAYYPLEHGVELLPRSALPT